MTNAPSFQVLQHETPIKATPQRLLLAPGLYALTVVEGGQRPETIGGVPVPSLQVSAPPGTPAGVEIIGSLSGGWLTRRGDALVVKVPDAAASLLLTSYKLAERPDVSLGIRILRLDEGAPSLADEPPAPPVRAEILVHVQSRGDLAFPAGQWAGSTGQRQSVEGFGIVLSGDLDAESIEYRALLASGWETPWVPGGQLCGSRGMGVPIVGFAIRLAGAAAARYECFYEGAFLSGYRSGPLQDGAACQSDAADDPLEAILFRLAEKPGNAEKPMLGAVFRRP